MKKIILQFSAIIVVFLSIWFIINQIQWMTLFKVNEVSRTTERKLGDMYWDMIEKSEKVIKDKDVNPPIDTILTRICNSNHIKKQDIKIHIVENAEVNAFALPNKHLVIYTGLIKSSENESELSGVICHELAHIELKHVMKKLIKEVGLSVLISMTTNNTGGETIRQTTKMLSSSAYDRKLEKEADLKAIEYLTKSGINPLGFADFLNRLAGKEPDAQKYLTWISTHPDSKERADYIKQSTKSPLTLKLILTPASWTKLKEKAEKPD